METQKEIGDLGEDIAAQYLIKNGYKILERKWHYGHLELDIIALEGNELVIVEVKTRSGIPYEFPSDALSNRKITMLIEAADAYIQQQELVYETRFDLISIFFSEGTHQLDHYKEAFFP